MGAVNSIADVNSNFHFKDNYINVDKTGAPYSVAHPDATLLMAGFARASVTESDELTFIGTSNSVAVMESQGIQPIKELGSSRYIMTTNNNPVTLQLNSVLINGPNLLRSLYGAATKLTGLVNADTFDLANFSEMISDNPDGTAYGGWANLDYPLFSVPFGMAVVSRNIAGTEVQSVYAECCLIQNWAWRVQAGQSAVFTDVTILADRVLPYRFASLAGGNAVSNFENLNTIMSSNSDGIPDASDNS